MAKIQVSQIHSLYSYTYIFIENAGVFGSSMVQEKMFTKAPNLSTGEIK